ncbi:hypothetical protein [uncultured Muribaculum sp.]|uniref:hypothetical protein n=1 Tax=uncultured Muribaculum sp. TaxID=1918613 RepID=UPI0025FD77EB|nr:hypothetical protein [uncultured Muribaculum sp.]
MKPLSSFVALSHVLFAVLAAVDICAALSVSDRRYYPVDAEEVAVPDHVEGFTVEVRASLPRVKEGRGLSCDWWGMADADGHWIALRGFNSDYGSVLDRRGLRLSCGYTGDDSRRVAVDSVDLFDGVNLMRGFNTVALEWHRASDAGSADRLDIYVGSDEPVLAMSVKAQMPRGRLHMVGEGDRIVETLMTEWITDARDALFSGWTDETLAARMDAPLDYMEGRWEYLDRNTDDARARLGGKYRLAVVQGARPGCYDILYLGGAEIGATTWYPMMFKGRLMPSRFEHMWEVEWYDAMGVMLDDDEAYATLAVQEWVITLEFPLYRSRIRFAKVQ